GFGVLEYGADFPGQLVHGRRSRVKSVHIYPPFQAAAGGKGRDQAVDQLCHRSLAAAGGPAQQDALPRRDGGADLGERLLRFPVAEGNIVNAYHCHCLLYCTTNESTSKTRLASIPKKSGGEIRRDTALVLRAGLSMPRVTAP